jgi:hypothetical protein
MDTINFNKHDIDIFINLAKIVRYDRHWDESCNEWRLLLIEETKKKIKMARSTGVRNPPKLLLTKRTFDIFILISVKWNLSSHILYFIYMQRLTIQFVEMHCTIDFNKHDIDIFINLAKIVRYDRHWDESCNEWRLLLIIYFDSNFPNAKLRPYDDNKNMSTIKYILWHFVTIHSSSFTVVTTCYKPING